MFAHSPSPKIFTEESNHAISLKESDFPKIELTSMTALLVEKESFTPLYAKNANKRIYPASMTKLMTALVVMEYGPDLTTEITLDHSMFESLYEQNASLAGFSSGDTVTTEDLFYGMLVPSGAEATMALVLETSEDEKSFVQLMNQTATALGLHDTHFMNPTGLPNSQHYSTAYDMALLLSSVLEHPFLKKVISTPSYKTFSTPLESDGIAFYSTIFGRELPENATLHWIEGGKTGYTEEAGQCLASFTTINGIEHIAVVAGAPGDSFSLPYHILDTEQIYEELANTSK